MTRAIGGSSAFIAERNMSSAVGSTYKVLVDAMTNSSPGSSLLSPGSRSTHAPLPCKAVVPPVSMHKRSCTDAHTETCHLDGSNGPVACCGHEGRVGGA